LPSCGGEPARDDDANDDASGSADDDDDDDDDDDALVAAASDASTRIATCEQRAAAALDDAWPHRVTFARTIACLKRIGGDKYGTQEAIAEALVDAAHADADDEAWDTAFDAAVRRVHAHMPLGRMLVECAPLRAALLGNAFVRPSWFDFVRLCSLKRFRAVRARLESAWRPCAPAPRRQ